MVEFTFGESTNWGVELETDEKGTDLTFIDHTAGAVRIQSPASVRINLQGEKEAYALAEALIFAGETLRQELDNYRLGVAPIFDGEHQHPLKTDFPWDLEKSSWKESWLVAELVAYAESSS